MSQQVQLIDCIPTELQGTTLGAMLATRIVQSDWQAISVDDIPEKWLATFHNKPEKWEDGCVGECGKCGTIMLVMPDELCCQIYMQWSKKQPTTKLDCMIESTQTFINEYGPDTHRRTLLSLAVHGKPEAIFVETAPPPAGWARPPYPPTSTETRPEI